MLGVVLILVFWAAVAASPLGSSGAIPTPVEVVVLFGQAFGSSSFWEGIGVTSLAALEGYVAGNLIALALAFLVLLVPRSEGISTQLAVVSSCLPLTAIGPLVAIMSPAGSRFTSVFLAALSVIFTTVVGSVLGLKSASSTQLDVISAYGGTRFTQIRKVRLIAATPSLLAALKIAAPAAFLGAVLGEYFLVGVDQGVGVLLLSRAVRQRLHARVGARAHLRRDRRRGVLPDRPRRPAADALVGGRPDREGGVLMAARPRPRCPRGPSCPPPRRTRSATPPAAPGSRSARSCCPP